MTADNEIIFRRWVNEVWNKKRENAIDEMFAENGLAICPNNPPANPIRGIEEFKNFFRRRIRAVRNMSMTVEELACEDGKVTALCRVKGVKQNENSRKPAEEIEISGLYIVKIIAGKITEAWHGFDFDNRYRTIDDLLRQWL